MSYKTNPKVYIDVQIGASGGIFSVIQLVELYSNCLSILRLKLPKILEDFVLVKLEKLII